MAAGGGGEGGVVLGRVAVGKREERALSGGLKRDLDCALAGCYGKRAALPAPREHQPAVRNDLYHLAADALVAGDVIAVLAAGMGTENSLVPHPATHLRRVGRDLDQDTRGMYCT